MDSTAFIKAHNAPGLCSRTSVIFSGVFPDGYSARYSMLLLYMLAIVIHILGPPSHRWQKQAPNQLEVGAVTPPSRAMLINTVLLIIYYGFSI